MLRLQKLAAQVVLPTWSFPFPPSCAHPYPYDHMHYVEKGVLCGPMATIDISRKCASRSQVSILARKNNFNKLRSYLLTWVKALDEGKHRVHTNDSKPCFGSESIQNHANMHSLWKVELWHWTVVLQGCRLFESLLPIFLTHLMLAPCIEKCGSFLCLCLAESCFSIEVEFPWWKKNAWEVPHERLQSDVGTWGAYSLESKDKECNTSRIL